MVGALVGCASPQRARYMDVDRPGTEGDGLQRAGEIVGGVAYGALWLAFRWAGAPDPEVHR